MTADQLRAQPAQPAVTAGPAAPARDARHLARALLDLTKPRIVALLLVTTVPAMLLAGRRVPAAGLIAATLAGGALAAGGANALNMVWDRDIDAGMSRTGRRPLVTGALTPRTAALFACGLEAAAFALLWGAANLLAALLAIGAAVFYVGVYTMLLKRSTTQNIVIGGAAGAAPVLAGWAAVTGGLSPAAWELFALIFLWTPPHFWALAVRFRGDYARVRVPMLPAVAGLHTVANRILGYTIALAALSLAIGPLNRLGPVYLAVALALGGMFSGQAWRLRRDPTPQRAMKLFRCSIVYLSLLFITIGAAALAP